MAQEIYKRRFGDRKDGRLLHSLSPSRRLAPYISPKRNDACNQFAGSVELGAAESWIREKRQQNWKGMGMLHLFLAAYLRTLAAFPGLNRFVSGQKIYARNTVEVILAVTRSTSGVPEETAIKVTLDPADTVFDVYRKLEETVDELQATERLSDMERLAESFLKIPGPILKFLVWFLNLLDYFGRLPQTLLRLSPYHGSMLFTDLGSLGTAPVARHITNFGNLSLSIAMGTERRGLESDGPGIPTERKYMDYSIVMDERIADSVYFSGALRLLNECLKNPQLLERPPERVAEDVF